MSRFLYRNLELLEPYEGKLSCTVLRGESSRKGADLPDQIKFAGTRISVISREGDVLVPKVTVYYDGAVTEAEIYDNIESKLNEYIMNMEFDSSVYTSKILEVIKSAEHVTDVYIDPEDVAGQGIFLACYDGDGHISPQKKIGRVMQTESGYLRQSSGKNEEADIPNFREAIKLVVDTK